MSLQIVRRSIGDITILDCVGRPTLGEGSSMFRDVIRNLVSSGRKKIILNFSGVTYIDSSGLGELVSAFTTVANQHGSLVFLNKFSARFKNQIQITKFYSLYQCFEDEPSAIRYLELSPLHCLCPICGARSSPALLDGSSWPPQTCSDSNCGVQFSLAPSIRNAGRDLIETVRIPTYAEEYFEITTDTPFNIAIVGRLNLFTSSTLATLWRALPARIAIFDLRLATEITPEGRNALLRLVSQPGKDEGAAISLEGVGREQADVFSSAPPVYPERTEALAALREHATKMPLWLAKFQ